MKKNKCGVLDIAILLLSAVLLIGLFTFLKPCGPKEDGSWMTCHWAGQALTGSAATLLVLGIARLFADPGMKRGLDIAAAVLSVLCLCLPGHLIGLCMMPDMRCRSVMTPGASVLSVLLILAAAADFLLQKKRETK